MKKTLLIVIALIVGIATASAARMMPTTGRVVDQKGTAIEYATVVLLKNNEQVAGMATDTEGRFELKVSAGEYTLSIQYLGYEPFTQQLQLMTEKDLGDLVLTASSTEIEQVVVKGQLIRREADRFIVDVANTPAATGKDGVELLERAPGVWVENDKLSINGKSGSKVYINDRLLRMSGEELINYLRTLRAEEIQKIEVIPTSGADQDADSASGIIKITLKKRRENGLDGSLSMRTTQSEITHQYNPGGNLNIHTGKMDLYLSGWGYLGNEAYLSNEHTKYSTSDAEIRSRSKMLGKFHNWGGSTGAVYELSPKHSIGAEFNYWCNNEPALNDSYTEFTTPAGTTRTDSRYDNLVKRHNYTTMFNYIWKIDTLGSTLKLLADYTRQTSTGNNDNLSHIAAPAVAATDSLYRDLSSAQYSVVTATLALDKKFSAKWSLQAGVKHTYNDMRNKALYEYVQQENWVRNEELSYTINYTENITAGYGILTGSLGRWSVVAGLRGEYTHTRGKGGAVSQDYFSLFPNANLSYSLKKDGSYSLIAQYARTIGRPNFWSLNPQRMQISDYTYQIGNPMLNPSYKQDVNLTLVLKHKYTLTAGVSFQKDEIQETMRPDEVNPDKLQLTWVNYDTTTGYYLSANLPFQFTKWWQTNINATYMRSGQRIDQHAAEKQYNFVFANTSMTFTLPAKFYIDLSYNFQSRISLGNVWVNPMHRLHASIKKRFGENFTASFGVRNLLDQGQTIGANGNGFVRSVKMIQPWSNRTYQIGISYNFKSGKAFNRKTVEAGSAGEKSRL